MRANEIMESELSPRNTARFNRATESFSNGFESEAARKEAMTDLGRIYEDGLREQVQNKLNDLFWSTMKGDNIIHGKQAEHAEVRKLMDMLPYGLSQIREKHFSMFEKYGNLPLLKKLVMLRQEMKDAPLVPKKRDLEKAAKAAALAANTIIADATHPLKEAALARTLEKSEDFVAWVKARLEHHGFDPYAIVPNVPTIPYNSAKPWEIKDNREKRADADNRRAMYTQFLQRSGDKYSWSQELADRYVEMCLASTAAHYDSYVSKMNDKIKNPVSASFRWVGDVWGHSELIIQLADGSTEVWKTQTIVNCSKLGKLFNQWPSRRVK
jgi:hypothetical protein